MSLTEWLMLSFKLLLFVMTASQTDIALPDISFVLASDAIIDENLILYDFNAYKKCLIATRNTRYNLERRLIENIWLLIIIFLHFLTALSACVTHSDSFDFKFWILFASSILIKTMTEIYHIQFEQIFKEFFQVMAERINCSPSRKFRNLFKLNY